MDFQRSLKRETFLKFNFSAQIQSKICYPGLYFNFELIFLPEFPKIWDHLDNFEARVGMNLSFIGNWVTLKAWDHKWLYGIA